MLVTFWSRTGRTEKLALAAALGAVQARANIRLRWLREDVDERLVGEVPGWSENRERMSGEYVAPREADLAWADAVIVGAPARAELAGPEFQAYFELLRGAHGKGQLHSRAGAAVISGAGANDCALPGVYEALARLDLILVPAHYGSEADALQAARAHGRRVTEVARALKAL